MRKNRVTICVPLISGIFGILMPAESYRFVPLEPFKNFMFQFDLNPYALQTAGYKYDTFTDFNKVVNTLEEYPR